MQLDVLKCPKCGARIPVSEALTVELEQKVRAEVRSEVFARATEEAQAAHAGELERMKRRLTSTEAKLKQAADKELALLEEKREIQNERDQIKLEVARKLDKERRALSESITRRVEEEHQQRALEKDKHIADLTNKIEALKKRADRGSEQLQGEVRELSLEDLLTTTFPSDVIEEVPKGRHGADVVHKVMDRAGRHCGTIVWESKQTRNWSEGWIAKLKGDARAIQADVAVLLSAAMPNGEVDFCARDGVYVANPRLALCLATVLRAGIESTHGVRVAVAGKQDKAEYVYDYLGGVEFRDQVAVIVESYQTMHQDLELEKRAMMSIWAKREKQLGRLIDSTGRIYGSIKGIMGKSLPEFAGFDFKLLGDGKTPTS
jgi:hypothetical protein